LHYLADKEGLSPDRLSAVGYGEYQPVASNDTGKGRQLNRRVEIIILPQVTKVKGSEPGPKEIPAGLK
jgi:chemotaxis protein MotB